MKLKNCKKNDIFKVNNMIGKVLDITSYGVHIHWYNHRKEDVGGNITYETKDSFIADSTEVTKPTKKKIKEILL